MELPEFLRLGERERTLLQQPLFIAVAVIFVSGALVITKYPGSKEPTVFVTPSLRGIANDAQFEQAAPAGKKGLLGKTKSVGNVEALLTGIADRSVTSISAASGGDQSFDQQSDVSTVIQINLDRGSVVLENKTLQSNPVTPEPAVVRDTIIPKLYSEPGSPSIPAHLYETLKKLTIESSQNVIKLGDDLQAGNYP